VLNAFRSSACERARGWISLELDGELSEVEHALLADHTARCPACAEARRDLSAVARLLRTTPAEAPQRSFMPPRRRRTPVRAVAVAAVLALAVGVGFFGASLGGGTVEDTPETIDVAFLSNNERQEFWDIRRGDLAPPAHRFEPPGRLSTV
jgi:predicted anti-sigma-YlaC factor YlaD